MKYHEMLVRGRSTLDTGCRCNDKIKTVGRTVGCAHAGLSWSDLTKRHWRTSVVRGSITRGGGTFLFPLNRYQLVKKTPELWSYREEIFKLIAC
jgi:hypothetical protein